MMQSGNSCTWQAKPFWFLFQLKVDTSTILLSVTHFNTGVLGVDADGRLDVFLARICVRGSLHLQPLLLGCSASRVRIKTKFMFLTYVRVIRASLLITSFSIFFLVGFFVGVDLFCVDFLERKFPSTKWVVLSNIDYRCIIRWM